MGFLLTYSLESAILLCILFSIYLLIGKSGISPSVRRVSLLIIYCLAALLPFLGYELNHGIGDVAPDYYVYADSYLMANQPLPDTFQKYYVMAWILIAGMAFILLRMIATLLYITYLFIKGSSINKGDVAFTVLADRNFSPFCFGRRIFVSEEEFCKMSDMVLCHEKSHISRRHFLDLIFSQVMTTIQWWNPMAWIMKRDLKDIHEFQADNDVLSAGFSRTDYQYMLLERTAGNLFLIPGHGLRNSRLRGRLKMMNRDIPSGQRLYRVLLLIPAAAIGVLIISSPIISPLLLNASRVSLPEMISNTGNEKSNTELKWEPTIAYPAPYEDDNVTIIVNGKVITRSDLKAINPEMIESITVMNNQSKYPGTMIDISLKSANVVREDISLEDVEVVAVGSYKK